jgi:HEPN domain-containing protein/predicted nucleotidyltransferase
MLEIVWPEDLEPRRQLLHRERERMVEVLRQMPAVKKVIAFGSSLSGDIHESSDIDLIVVMETQERFIERGWTLWQVLKPAVATDLMVYTPHEFEEMVGRSDFVQTAVETGSILYDTESLAETTASGQLTKQRKSIMAHDHSDEASRWFQQAEHDLATAIDLCKASRYDWACFAAQQSAEKALKAVLFASGAKRVRGHSIADLGDAVLQEVPSAPGLPEEARHLDLYYIPARYPNGLNTGVPYKAFTAKEAERAIDSATQVVRFAESTIRTLLSE